MGSKLTIDEGRCVHRLTTLAQCQACVQACPRSAWTIGAQGLGFDELRCDGCGLCMAECPTGALAVPLPWPAVRLECGGVRTVTLPCEKAPGATPDGASIPCVHALDEAQLLRWHAQGVGRLSFITGDCESCARRTSTGQGKRLHRLNEALRLRGQRVMCLDSSGDRHGGAATVQAAETQVAPVVGTSVPPITTGSVKLAEPPPNRARRGLLGLLSRPLPPDSPAKLATAGALVPRCEATQLLARLGRGPVLWAVAFDARRCDACGVCAELCPTQAIAMMPAAATTAGVLAFNMSRCVGCDACVDACVPAALAPAAPLSTTGDRQAWSLDSAPCPQCGKAHRRLRATSTAPSSGRCPACRSQAARRSDRIVQAASEALPHAGQRSL